MGNGPVIIRNGDVIAWVDGKHEWLPAADVVFDGATIVHVGPGYDGGVASSIDATGRLVIPGFVNAHLHATDTPFTRGYLEDIAASTQHVETLYRVLPTIRNATAPEDALAAAKATFAELLLSGSTTIVEMGYDEEMLDGRALEPTAMVAHALGESGLRGYIAPRYRAAHWRLSPGVGPEYSWYADRGAARFVDCVAFCEAWRSRFGDRVRSMLAPGQVDTCEPEMLRETRRIADESGLLIQLHAGQSPPEFKSVQRQRELGTVDYLDSVGLLGSDFLIGHGMFLSETGAVGEIGERSLARLAQSGTSIVALPWVKARVGGYMRSLEEYRRAGVQMALGTDTHPFDMFNEMRTAAVMCKVAEGDPGTGTARVVFDIATVGGAQALGRCDLGRLAPGAKADIVLVDIDQPHAQPMNDPFKFLVFSASGRDVASVFIDGEQVVADRQVTTMDVRSCLSDLAAAADRVWDRVSL